MNDIKAIQLNLKETLKVFHAFCVNHSLCYYSAGGTTLGALRHHGFIPWDDDIDVAMPRPDYMRLIEIFNKEVPNKRYILESPSSNDPFFLYPYSKLYDTHTTLVEQIRHPLKRGLNIDIFPIDGAGASEKDSLQLMKTIRRLLFLRDLRTVLASKERSLYKNLILKSIQFVPRFMINDKKINLRIDSLCRTFDYSQSDYVGIFTGRAGEKEIVPKSVFGNPVLYPFEDIQIYCPEDADTYLTRLYGDWRTPPPEGQQITSHTYYLDLTKSYLD